MAADLNPEIKITAKDEASKVLKGVADSAEDTGKSIKDTLKESTASLATGFALATGAVWTCISAFSESQAAATQLNAVLKSTKGASGLLAEDILDQAAALQQLTTFEDDAIVSGSNLLLTFTNIKGPIMQEAIGTMLDMSQALGQDLKGSAIQLGKALNDPINGITALRRVGVSFTEDQQKQIETLVNSGKTMEAQKLILAELATEFGGSAAAAAQTFGGQMIQLKNNVDDLQETMGQGLVETLTQLTGGFNNANASIQNLNVFLTQHKDILAGISLAMLALVAGFGVLLLAAIAATAGIGLAFALLAGAIVASIAFAAGVIINQWEGIKQVASINIAIMTKDFGSFISYIGDSVKAFGAYFKSVWEGLPQVVKDVLKAIMDYILGFNPIIKIGIEWPDIVGGWNSLKATAKKWGIPGFQTGGVVPGPVGAPQLALVHGGETVTPYRRGGGGSGGGAGMNLNVYVGLYAGSAIEKRRIAEELYNGLIDLAKAQNKTVSELLGG